MRNNWNNITEQIKPGPWDHITQEMRDAERVRIKKMTDKKLVAYYYEAPNPIYKRSAGWEIVMIRRLMNWEQLHTGGAK